MNSINEYYKTKIDEASEIKLDEFPSNKLNESKQFMKILGVKDVLSVFDGIHGYIITYDNNNGSRLAKSELDKLIKVKSFRWLECSDDTISIGF